MAGPGAGGTASITSSGGRVSAPPRSGFDTGFDDMAAMVAERKPAIARPEYRHADKTSSLQGACAARPDWLGSGPVSSELRQRTGAHVTELAGRALAAGPDPVV